MLSLVLALVALAAVACSGSPCCSAQLSTVGCASNSGIEGCVCAVNPLCCLVAWDQSCADTINDVCSSSFCPPPPNSCFPVCGDGATCAPTEECDDGNLDSTDACVACARARCGDGFLRANASDEECDDGNTVNTDGCLSTCRLARCHDGWVRTGFESCDDGATDTSCCLGCVRQTSCVACAGPSSVRVGTCDASGLCVGTATVSCAPYACVAPGSCRTSCTPGMAADCAENHVCVATGVCVPQVLPPSPSPPPPSSTPDSVVRYGGNSDGVLGLPTHSQALVFAAVAVVLILVAALAVVGVVRWRVRRLDPQLRARVCTADEVSGAAGAGRVFVLYRGCAMTPISSAEAAVLSVTPKWHQDELAGAEAPYQPPPRMRLLSAPVDLSSSLDHESSGMPRASFRASIVHESSFVDDAAVSVELRPHGAWSDSGPGDTGSGTLRRGESRSRSRSRSRSFSQDDSARRVRFSPDADASATSMLASSSSSSSAPRSRV